MASAAQKIRTYLPIEITAQDAVTGIVIAGPLIGRIFDIAGNRASLLMGRIMDKYYHFFYSTQEHPGRLLQLSVDLPDGSYLQV